MEPPHMTMLSLCYRPAPSHGQGAVGCGEEIHQYFLEKLSTSSDPQLLKLLSRRDEFRHFHTRMLYRRRSRRVKGLEVFLIRLFSNPLYKADWHDYDLCCNKVKPDLIMGSGSMIHHSPMLTHGPTTMGLRFTLSQKNKTRFCFAGGHRCAWPSEMPSRAWGLCSWGLFFQNVHIGHGTLHLPHTSFSPVCPDMERPMTNVDALKK